MTETVTKRCKTCGEDRPITSFDIAGKWRANECRRCKKRRRRASVPERHSEDLARWRINHIRSTYGITGADYRELVQEQEGRCAICREPLACIDHCHATGWVRGLLCQDCNRGLGSFKDNPDLLARAILYVSDW